MFQVGNVNEEGAKQALSFNFKLITVNRPELTRDINMQSWASICEWGRMRIQVQGHTSIISLTCDLVQSNRSDRRPREKAVPAGGKEDFDSDELIP